MKHIFLTLSLALLGLTAKAQVIPDSLFCNSHDIRTLGEWGPYSKQYAGISFIEEISSGRRVDFTVVPGLYRRSYDVPNLLFESDCHPWKVSADLSEITWRHELEWKDRLYVDVTYSVMDSSRVCVEMHCVNNSDVPQNILLHTLMSMHYAEDHPRVKATGTENVIMVHGCDYHSFEPAVKGCDYSLVYDGWMRGEERESRSLSGSVLGKFGLNAGDIAEYTLQRDCAIPEASVALCCLVEKGMTAKFHISGICECDAEIEGDGEYEIIMIGNGNISPGDNTLTFRSLNAVNMKIDAIFAGLGQDVGKIRIEEAPLKFRPSVERHGQDVIVNYPECGNSYAIAWDYPHSEIREFWNSELDTFMRRTVHRHPPKFFTGDREGHFTSAFLRPVVLRPRSDTTIVNMLATGDVETVRSAIKDYHRNGLPSKTQHTSTKERYLPEAGKYALGRQLLEATLLTNIVYPVYTQGEYIRHFTPGKNWNSLYTWDEGCISLALNEIDPIKAFETLRAYTTEDGSQSAFIHHGTPLPIQFFAFSELCNGLQDKRAMEWLYPRLKRYYDYMTGKNQTSTTLMPSGLLRTWDYFYSSGGWDDYPPQHMLRTDRHLYPSVTPVVSTAYYLRAGKILRLCAAEMGLKADVMQYDKDIRNFSEALQKYSWDNECGYFSYVMHNDGGEPTGFYRHSDGSNFNMGLDGVSPLVGGCCTEEQKNKLLEKLFSPEHLWTDVGISTVDKSASYYDPTGYWNGCVWVPHQYFIWKALLDCGQAELASKLALTILDTWERECRESYWSFEHFIISSGRGAGWHSFSGLSSPVINLHDSYFRIGHIATGFDTAVKHSSFNDSFTECKATLVFDKSSIGQKKSLLICMSPGSDYNVLVNGSPAEFSSPFSGLLQVSMTATTKPMRLEVIPI